MLILLSPAKSLDFEAPLLTRRHSQPRLLEQSELLVEQLRQLPSSKLKKLMSLSDTLVELNAERYAAWTRESSAGNSRPALLAFTGGVYQGMELDAWSTEDFAAAQKQLRILSGLYGVLRPLDRILPYRLEMGTKLTNVRGKNLYTFWGDQISDLLNKDLKASGSDRVVNLASNEYFSAVNKARLNGEIISPVFKDEKNGQYKIISFFAKKARGMMADYIIRRGATTLADLKRFRGGGYRYNAKASSAHSPVFLRKS